MEYFNQKKDYTCGCASVRMVLSTFGDIDNVPSEDVLEKILGTNDRIGTHPDRIEEYFRLGNFDVLRGVDGSCDKIEKLISEGYCVMLMVSVDVPHITVVNKINPTHIFLYDPFYGRISKDRRKFESDKHVFPHYRWRIVAKEFEKYAIGYDFSALECNKAYIAVRKS